MYQDEVAVSGSSEDIGVDHNCFVKKPLGSIDVSKQNREEVQCPVESTESNLENELDAKQSQQTGSNEQILTKSSS